MIEYRTQTDSKPFHVQSESHLIVTDGGMGDLICELVAVDYNIRNFRKVRFHVWVPDYLLPFAQHVLSPGGVVRSFSEAPTKFSKKFDGLTTEWCTNHTCMRTHPVDYGFHMLSDRHIYDLNQKNYLQIKPDRINLSQFNLPDNFICIVVAASEPVKEMPVDTLHAIADYAIKRGYECVFLGKENSDCGFKDLKLKAKAIPIDYSKGLNLLNKTDTLQAAGVISKAKCIIGMDGGLIHLAGCTDTEIVAGYTLVDPVHVAPIRKGSQSYKLHAVEPDLDIPNRYYQTYKSGFQKGDFRKFPGWEKVIKSMTPDKFIKVLYDIL